MALEKNLNQRSAQAGLQNVSKGTEWLPFLIRMRFTGNELVRSLLYFQSPVLDPCVSLAEHPDSALVFPGSWARLMASARGVARPPAWSQAPGPPGRRA